MRAPHILALALVASASFASGAAMAGDTVHLTPPLFREQARDTQQVRRVSDLTTVPQPVAAAKPTAAPRTVRVVADAEAALAQ